MPFAQMFSGAIVGISPCLVKVEANIYNRGFPSFNIVGLPSREIVESKERIRSAVRNSGYKFPNRRITINLTPANVPKHGSLYDLPIAVALLMASGLIDSRCDNCFIFGELSLNGVLNPVISAVPLTFLARDKFKEVVLPELNADQVSVVRGIKIKAATNLIQVVKHLNGEEIIDDYPHTQFQKVVDKSEVKKIYRHDFKYIRGQLSAKRALEIAAAGRHNVSLRGPPGSGKSMLAKSFRSILPNLVESEAFELLNLYSAAGKLKKETSFILNRPFRAPHHSISKVGLIGGGNPIRPGEISLAHNGVLFLDEFCELDKHLIECLRQPIENGEIVLVKAGESIRFPAKIILIISSNLCPCGNQGRPDKECTCYANQIKRYEDKLSGPIMDRIDIHVTCEYVNEKDYCNITTEPSSSIKKRVQKARDLQTKRYVHTNFKCNGDLDVPGIIRFCKLGDDENLFLKNAVQKLHLSARVHDKIIKVARTIADLEGLENILKNHIAEALQYRYERLT